MAEEARALVTVNMLWIGERLGVVERLSILSYLQQGHPVRLHVYGEVQDVPDGAELADANETMPFDMAMSLWIPLNGGSYALASDYFRMKLMQSGAGLWSDSDMICLCPIEVEGNLFGLETDASINTAILRLDPDSPIVRDILAGFSPNHVPYWLPAARQVRWWARKLTFRPFGATDFRWGTLGPRALTGLARRYGVDHLAAPVDVYYPLPLERWREAFEPGGCFDEFVTERSRTIHLWHSHIEDATPPPSSAVGRLAARLGA